MATKRPYRILFACPQTVFDVSNGASMQIYSLLQEFSRRGIDTATFCGGVMIPRVPPASQTLPNRSSKTKVRPC